MHECVANYQSVVDERQEFLTCDGAVAEDAQHTAGDEIGAGFHDAACCHALMLRLDEHGDSLRL